MSVATAERFNPMYQVPFPVARYFSVIGLFGTLIHHGICSHVGPCLLARSCPRHPLCTTLRRCHDCWRCIRLEILCKGLDRSPRVRFLSWDRLENPTVASWRFAQGSGSHPLAIATVWLILSVPNRTIRSHDHTLRRHDLATEFVLDILAQPLMCYQFRDFRLTSTPFGVPLGNRGFVIQSVRPCRCITPELSRDR